MVAGMRDNSCRERITSALESVTGVTEVHVNLFRAQATVVHGRECCAEDLVRALRRIGYDTVPRGRGPGV